MLRQIRSLTRGWIAWALLILLTVAFAAWGINDVFNGVGAQNVARVDGRDITPAQLSRELELTLRAQRREGRNITQQEAIEAGVHLRLLESLITRSAMYAYAEKAGVSASNAQVAERIRQIPAVINPLSGAFDETAYEQFLREYSYSRPEFEREMRNDLTSEMLRHAMSVGVRAPTSFGALVLAFETETRVVSIAEAPMALAGAVPAPTEAQLQTYYEENSAALQVPEYRALTLVIASAAAFAERVDVPEQRLREEFEARRASLTRPEQRTYVRLAAANEQQANDAAARLQRGEAPNAVAQALGMQLTRGENQTREQVADDTVGDAIFAMRAGEGARAVRAALSPWAVVRLETITPAQAPDFASARGQLRNDIAADEASELLNTAIGAFEEARAAGADVAAAGRGAGLGVISIPAVDAQGLDRSGAPVAGLAEQQDLLSIAFETAEGEASDFVPSGDTDVVISVSQIVPASTRPLAEVREQLAASWQARERARRLRELGDEVVAAVRGGQSFAAAARARRMNVVITSRPIDRRGASQLPARQLGGLIFNAVSGAVVADGRADGGALLLAQVEEINRVDPAEAAQLVESARGQIQEALGASLDEAFAAQVVASAHPRRNERVLQQLFGGGESEESQP